MKYMNEKFKVGDKVTLINNQSKHCGEEGVVREVKRHTKEGPLLSIRYVVVFNNPNITASFILHELDIEYTIVYNRERILNDLGI